MRKNNRRVAKIKSGHSMIEILVAATILVLVTISIFSYMRSISIEEVHLDSRAKALQNYLRLRTFLRHDVVEAYKIDVLNEKKIRLSLLEVDESFNEKLKEVIWCTEGSKKIIRIESGNKKVFDFSDSISSDESIGIKFAVGQQ